MRASGGLADRAAARRTVACLGTMSRLSVSDLAGVEHVTRAAVTIRAEQDAAARRLPRDLGGRG